MVSRLGHDLANPLTSILGYTQLLQKTEQVARNREYVDNIFGQTRRCQEIVEGFLSYVRGKGSGRFECDLEHIIEQSLELERAHFESGSIRVDRRLAGDLPPVAGNSFLLQEALLHIVHNAEQAMRDVPAPRRLEIATGRDEQMAWVEVADNGPGIHPAHVSRIFEPFFSTREDPGSDGLGLTVAARIIQEHGGTLQYVDGNEPGARFRIELPVPQEAPNAVAPSVSSEGPSPVADAPPAPEAADVAPAHEEALGVGNLIGVREGSLGAAGQRLGPAEEHAREVAQRNEGDQAPTQGAKGPAPRGALGL